MDGAGDRVRRDRARPDAARRRRRRGLPPAARGRRLVADPDAHRPRRRRGPGRRARRRRRRLPDEAVRVRRAAGAAARARAPRRRRAARRSWRSATSASTRPRGASGAAGRRSSSRRRSSRVLETFMRRPGRVLSRFELLEHAWDSGYEHRSNVIDVYVRYLREKIDRPFGRDSLETVRGAGYRLRPTAREPRPAPAPADPRVRARHGARARGDRALPPRPAARLARRADRAEPAGAGGRRRRARAPWRRRPRRGPRTALRDGRELRAGARVPRRGRSGLDAAAHRAAPDGRAGRRGAGRPEVHRPRGRSRPRRGARAPPGHAAEQSPGRRRSSSSAPRSTTATRRSARCARSC